jgi:hypothetical protein
MPHSDPLLYIVLVSKKVFTIVILNSNMATFADDTAVMAMGEPVENST